MIRKHRSRNSHTIKWLILFLMVLSYQVKSYAQTHLPQFIEIDNQKTVLIDSELGKREYCVAAYYFWRFKYKEAYYWLLKAESNRYSKEWLLDDFCESNYLYYMKGICEKEAKEYQKAVISFTKSIDITKRNSKKRNIKITKGKNIFYEEESYKLYLPDIYSDLSLSIENNDSTTILDSIIYSGKFLTLSGSSTYTINTYKAYCERADCKIILEDNFGAINDIQQYHFLTKDSSSYSCYLYAHAAQRLSKNKLAVKYYSVAIKKNDDLSNDGLITSYMNRAVIFYNDNLKEKACMDWSKAGELGCGDAYNMIKERCK